MAPNTAAVRPWATKRIVPYLTYPALLLTALLIAKVATAHGLRFGVTTALCTLLIGGLVFALESKFPFRRDWGATAPDLKADALHGLISNGVPSLVLEATLKGLLLSLSTQLRVVKGIDLWPNSLPLWTQVFLALFAAEVGFYTCHRLMHESNIGFLWRIHAVHHSAQRMYFLAGSRTHVLQVFLSFGSTVAILWALGAPDEVIFWKTIVHTTNGILQHANLDIRLGVLNWIIAGPELHRTHHAVDVETSNHNYGNNLILIDVLLGTRLYRSTPPKAVGIPQAFTNTFAGHLALPFTLQEDAGNDGYEQERTTP